MSHPTTKLQSTHRLPTGVLDIALMEDRHSILAACIDGVYELSLDDGTANPLYRHESYVSSVVYDQDRGTVISAGFDGHVKWYDYQSSRVIRDVSAHRFWSWKMVQSNDGKMIASVTGQYLAGSEKYAPRESKEPCVKVFDGETGELLHALPHIPSVQAVAISSDNRFLAAGNLMGEIRVWDLATGQRVSQWTTSDFTSWGIIKSHCYIGGIFALQFTPDGNHLIAAGMGPMRDPMAGNGRQLWQKFAWQQDPVEKVDETHPGESGEGLMETLAFHPSGDFFLMGGRLRGGKWNAALFATENGDNLHTMNTGYRMTSAFFSDNEQLFTAGCKKQPKPNKDGTFDPWGIVENRTVEYQNPKDA